MSGGAIDLTSFYEQLGQCRRRVGEVLAAAHQAFLRAMEGDSNVLIWYDQTFWVDRTRWLVVPMLDVGTATVGHTLQDDGDGGEVNETLAVYGGTSRMNWSHEIGRVLGTMLAGTTERRIWAMTGAHLLNLAVVQPLVNPPFGPLFWLALAEDTPGPADNLYTELTPMMFDMSMYPTRVPSPQEVRRAQGAFLLRLTSGLVGGDAEQRSPDDWLRICTWQLYAQWPMMDRLFNAICSRTTQAEIEARESTGQ